jgi:hypothetical protein
MAVKWLGTTDDVTTCDHCGKRNLKNTVALSIDEGEPVYYGVDCAARALSRSQKEVRSESRKADRAKWEAEQRRRAAAEDAVRAPWFAFLREHGRGSDDFTRIESLGGYAAARARYNASRPKDFLSGK